MSQFFRFDPEKALNVILYVASRLPYPGFFQISKIIYFADKDHLQRYGRQICGDDYAALPNGPVPSATYNMMKAPKGIDGFQYVGLIEGAFSVEEGHVVVPLRSEDLDFLSESDIECLDRAIKKYGRLGFVQLKRLSHDRAWEVTWKAMEKGNRRDNFIDISTIIRTLNDGESLLEHLEESHPNALK